MVPLVVLVFSTVSFADVNYDGCNSDGPELDWLRFSIGEKEDWSEWAMHLWVRKEMEEMSRRPYGRSQSFAPWSLIVPGLRSIPAFAGRSAHQWPAPW
jgi:hypothetical protein